MNTETTTPNRKRKLYAVLPDGTIATRTTARTYSHVVAVMVSAEQQLAYNVETIAKLEGNIAATDYNDWVQHEDGRWWNDGCGSHEHPHVDWQNEIDDRRAKIEAGFVDYWYDRSWAGRPDLAAKAANDKLLAKYRTMLVEVTDVEPTDEPVEVPEVEAPAIEAPAAVETAEAAEAELARRKHNKLVKKTGEGVRIEAASEWAFKASTEELRNLVAA